MPSETVRPASLRERKKQDTRIALFEAATELVLRDGFRATTVDAIAERAGVSRRTFFRYFPNKEAAFNGNHEERLEEFRGLLRSAAGGDSRLAVVRRACERASEYYVRQRELALSQFAAAEESPRLQVYDHRFDQRWEEAIHEALAGPGSSPPLESEDARIVAGAIFGVLRATLREWLRTGGSEDLIAMRSRAFERLETGFSS